MLASYRTWTGGHWRLVSLADLRYPGRSGPSEMVTFHALRVLQLAGRT